MQAITLFKSWKNTQEGNTSDSTKLIRVVEQINSSEVTGS